NPDDPYRLDPDGDGIACEVADARRWMNVGVANVVIGAILGGILTLVAQAAIQLLVIPRVESRKRREDRWERDVLALGEVLTGQLPPVLREYSIKVKVLIQLEGSEGLDTSKVRAFEDEARRAASELSSLNDSRIKWLASRVTAAAPESQQLKKFRFRVMQVVMCSSILSSWPYREEKDDEKFMQEVETYEKSVLELLTVVEELADMKHPPSRRQRLPKRWRARVRWKRGHRLP
ncbi:MAG: excalibur calcium-binding domain-containing protein, partial [Acidobacteria bacterium]|nr:excalibur calcium-binding domain-containing protein [Acidobacteriota bacterium]